MQIVFHEFVLLIELVHLGEECIIGVLFDPCLNVVNENNLWNLPSVFRFLCDWDNNLKSLFTFLFLWSLLGINYFCHENLFFIKMVKNLNFY